MSTDLCFNTNQFLDTTCRCCSRFFTEDIKLYKIFEEKLKCTQDAGSSGGDVGDAPDAVIGPTEMQYEPTEEVKDIIDEFILWNLNIGPMDGLPQQLCEECFQGLKQVHSFRVLCLDSQKILQSYFLGQSHMIDIECLSPKAESRKSPNVLVSDFVLSKNMDRSSPKSQADNFICSPFGSPLLRWSPRFADLITGFETTSPPQLFEEIRTEPIDMETLEALKSGQELEQHNAYKDNSSSDEAPSGVDNDDDEADADDDDSENESSSSTTEENAEDSSSSAEASPQYQQKKKKMQAASFRFAMQNLWSNLN